MKLADFVITAVVVVGLSGPAFAQTGSGQQSPTNAPVNQAVANTSSDNPRGWMASGFIGTNFGSSRSTSVDLSSIEDVNTNSSTSVNFGGQVAYLARRVIGGEFLADFSPGFGIFDNALFQESPNVNSYMFNLIAAAPFGQVHSVDPYVSGGIGAVTLRSTIFTLDPTRTPNINAIATETVSGSRFGWNLGGGVMAWSEKNWGFRGDARYYATTSGNNTDVLDLDHIGDGAVFTRLALSGISFWKANAGVAFRW
jgi:Outer membrane protein beta-barrel domain